MTTLKPLNLNSLIKQVIYPLSAFMRKRIRLKTIFTDKELRVLADWERMGHVIASLVEYGNKIIREQGIIRIETRLLPVENGVGENCGCALVSIATTDTSGMKTQADRGLFRMARSIIRNHNGAVRAFNREGKAECKIYLPLLPDSAKQQAGSPKPSKDEGQES